VGDGHYLIGRIIAANFLQGLVLVRSEADSSSGELLSYFDSVVAIVDGDVIAPAQVIQTTSSITDGARAVKKLLHMNPRAVSSAVN